MLLTIGKRVMGQIRQNYFVGIKTPWTLASEDVWQKTHRLAGKLWVVAGFFGIAGSIIGKPAGGIIMFTALGMACIIPVVYSFLEYRKTDSKKSQI